VELVATVQPKLQNLFDQNHINLNVFFLDKTGLIFLITDHLLLSLAQLVSHNAFLIAADAPLDPYHQALYSLLVEVEGGTHLLNCEFLVLVLLDYLVSEVVAPTNFQPKIFDNGERTRSCEYVLPDGRRCGETKANSF